MKNQLTALALITAAAFSLAPKPAQANDKGLAIAGGFLGGLIVASALNDNHHDHYYTASAPSVVVNDRGNDRCDDGFWKEVNVRVYVPAGWIEERGYRGECYRRYVGGHYEYRRDRVWVSYDRNDRGGYRR